jgi:hypothetical protein
MYKDKLVTTNEESIHDDGIQRNNSEISSVLEQNYLPTTSMTPNFKKIAQRDVTIRSGEMETTSNMNERSFY